MSIVRNPKRVRPKAIVEIAAQNLERLLARGLSTSGAVSSMRRR
jgi:hypothetical protein